MKLALALLLAASSALAVTPTPTRTPTPTGHSICPVPCDLYAIMYDYRGTFIPDVVGPYPPPSTAFVWPPWSAVAQHGPGVYTLAYSVHTPLGGWALTPQLFTATVQQAPPNPMAAWIEQFYHEGITAGCNTNPLIYCPNDPVTRAQMAVFGLKIEHGAAYVPPPCTGIFVDVPCATPPPTRTPTPGPTSVGGATVRLLGSPLPSRVCPRGRSGGQHARSIR